MAPYGPHSHPQLHGSVLAEAASLWVTREGERTRGKERVPLPRSFRSPSLPLSLPRNNGARVFRFRGPWRWRDRWRYKGAHASLQSWFCHSNFVSCIILSSSKVNVAGSSVMEFSARFMQATHQSPTSFTVVCRNVEVLGAKPWVRVFRPLPTDDYCMHFQCIHCVT